MIGRVFKVVDLSQPGDSGFTLQVSYICIDGKAHIQHRVLRQGVLDRDGFEDTIGPCDGRCQESLKEIPEDFVKRIKHYIDL